MKFLQCLFLFFVVTASTKGNMNIKYEDCGNTVGCVFGKSGCTSFEDCPMTGIYYYNKTSSMMYFQIKFTKKWAAFAQNVETQSDKMNDMRGFFCSKDGATEVLGFLKGNGKGVRPRYFTQSEVTESNGVMLTSADGLTTCSFMRPMTVSSTNGLIALYPLDRSDLVNVLSYGDSHTSGEPNQHSPGEWNIGSTVASWMMFSGEMKPVATTQGAPTTMATNETTMATNETTMTTEEITMTTEETTMTTEESTMAMKETTMAIDGTTMAPGGDKTGNKDGNKDSSSMMTQGSVVLVSMAMLMIAAWM